MPLGSSWGSEITAMIGQGVEERLLSFVGMALEQAWTCPLISGVEGLGDATLLLAWQGF